MSSLGNMHKPDNLASLSIPSNSLCNSRNPVSLQKLLGDYDLAVLYGAVCSEPLSSPSSALPFPFLWPINM